MKFNSKRSTGHTHTHTHTTAEHTTVDQTTHTNTKRATAQRCLIVEVVVAAPKIVAVRYAIENGACALVYISVFGAREIIVLIALAHPSKKHVKSLNIRKQIGLNSKGFTRG